MIAESTTIIGELENSLGTPVFAFLANWQGEYAVDADERAAQLLTTMIIDRLRRERAEEVTLILAARGGHPVFADIVLRTTEHLGVKLHVIVASRINGAAGSLAIAANRSTIHPQAGVGALDNGLCVVPFRSLDAGLFPHSGVDPVDFSRLEPAEQSQVARLALDRRIRLEQRRLAARAAAANLGGGEGSSVQPLMGTTLGEGMTVGAKELAGLGLDVEVAPAPLAEQLEDLLAWASEALSFYQDPGRRFQISETVADEVEFEPAELVAAAAIVGTSSVWLHKLDTGSPDPYAPRLLGRWDGWDPEGGEESSPK